jgi:hypothetical protein
LHAYEGAAAELALLRYYGLVCRPTWRENGNAFDHHLGGGNVRGDVRGVIRDTAHIITCFMIFVVKQRLARGGIHH